MALEVRPTTPASETDQPCQDFTFYSGGWKIGRIRNVPNAPMHLSWIWSLELQGPMKLGDQVPSLHEAEFQLYRSWEARRGLGASRRADPTARFKGKLLIA
jgi:hypothetical protein